MTPAEVACRDVIGTPQITCKHIEYVYVLSVSFGLDDQEMIQMFLHRVDLKASGQIIEVDLANCQRGMCFKATSPLLLMCFDVSKIGDKILTYTVAEMSDFLFFGRQSLF